MKSLSLPLSVADKQVIEPARFVCWRAPRWRRGAPEETTKIKFETFPILILNKGRFADNPGDSHLAGRTGTPPGNRQGLVDHKGGKFQNFRFGAKGQATGNAELRDAVDHGPGKQRHFTQVAGR